MALPAYGAGAAAEPLPTFGPVPRESAPGVRLAYPLLAKPVLLGTSQPS